MNAVVANDYQLCWQLFGGNDAVHAIQATRGPDSITLQHAVVGTTADR